jgi:putative flavoprotein involved in K+ transport
MPRRYRGRDVFAWLHAGGQLDARAGDVHDVAEARRAPGFPLSGAHGGGSIGLDRLAREGVTVCGRLEGLAGPHARFAADLAETVGDAERRMRRVLAAIDEHIERTGAPSGAPDAPPPVTLGPGPRTLRLGGSVATVLWATGYRRAYPWLRVPVLDGAGELVHREGVTAEPGLYALGLRFQRVRRSHLLGGVGDDAAQIAAAIAARSRPALPQAA